MIRHVGGLRGDAVFKRYAQQYLIVAWHLTRRVFHSSDQFAGMRRVRKPLHRAQAARRSHAGKTGDVARARRPREGDLESARLLVSAGADVNAIDGDGKDVLGLAIFNGNYDLASLLIDSHAKVNHADAQSFTRLFWAVDRRNMKTPPNFPWMVTTDPLPLIQKLLDAGANPNALVNNTPRARMRDGSPRIVYATALMRAASSGDLDLVKLLLAHGADPHIVSKDRETWLMGGLENGIHQRLQQRKIRRRETGSGQAAGGPGRGCEHRRQLRHYAADGGGEHVPSASGPSYRTTR